MNFDDIKVRIDKPYPEIVDAYECFQTVSILKNLANSRQGELRASLQYVFQSVVSDKLDEDIASVFEEIGIVEMMHLDMLMHAITSFGGVPKYEDAQGVPLNSNVVNYTVKLKEMLDNNIQGENMAIENYRYAIEKVKNKSLKALFERIIEDEQRHVEIFKTIRDNVKFLSI